MTKRFGVLLCLLFNTTFVVAQPAAMVPDDTAPDTAAIAPDAADLALARLLNRLDNAPVDLGAAARSSRRGTQMQNAGASFARTMEPVTPLLDGLANNPALTALSRVPVAGNPASSAQYTLQAVAGLNRGFARLVELDRLHVQPLREAAIAADRLRRSRNRDDVAAALQSFIAAQQQLNYHANLLRQQRRSLVQTTNSVQALLAYMPNLGGRRVPTPALLDSSLKGMLGAIDARLSQLGELERFTSECASDGQQALGS